ncbi:MAG: hypothetical protein U0Y82_12585 [Thermoleophilia bacterium]
MSTAAASPAPLVAAPDRPTWGRSFAAAVLGVLAGGLASAALLGVVEAFVLLAGGGPLRDPVGNALEPLSWFVAIPMVAAILVDAVCRREVFWLVTGRRPARGVAILAAVIAPSSVIGTVWRGGLLAYVLAASTVLMRCCARPTAVSPRRYLTVFMARPRGARAATAACGLLIAVLGLIASQVGAPAIEAAASATGTAASRHITLRNRSLAPVTVLGVGGQDEGYLRLGGTASAPFVINPGEGRDVTLVGAAACPGFSSTFTTIDLRYRILGIERLSSVDLGGVTTFRC